LVGAGVPGVFNYSLSTVLSPVRAQRGLLGVPASKG
jgi:hypothetical protein